MVERKIIGYRLDPIYLATMPSMATACIMSSMISGTVISNSGGGGNYITPEEFEVLKTNNGIRNLIKDEANKPKPTIIQVVVSMTDDAVYDGVIGDLRAEGFALKKRGVLGTTAFLVGEIYDTYLERARNIDGVETIQLKDDINF